VNRESDGVFAYGKPSPRVFVHIYTGQEEIIDSIGVSVPAAYSNSSQKAALLLCFKIAEHLDWHVFDQQLGDYLDKNTINEVLRSQKKFGDYEDEVLSSRASGKATFGEIYMEKFSEHSAFAVIPTLVPAAVVAGYVLVKRGMAEDSFVWVFLGAAAVLHVARALICTIWQRTKKGS
jgi:hypothetical protein